MNVTTGFMIMFAFEILEPWNSICICGANLDLFSPQEKLSDQIMATFHIPSLELMNLEETKKDLFFMKDIQKRTWNPLSNAIYLFFFTHPQL